MRWIIITAALALAATAAAAGDLPDPKKTPGLADPRLTKEILCAKDFTTASIRDVPEALHKKVYASYGMSPSRAPCPCEVDHLVSLELGGANDIKNLWPQSYVTSPWNAHLKDKLENRMHDLVCDAVVSLGDAQREIARDWIQSYRARLRDAPER